MARPRKQPRQGSKRSGGKKVVGSQGFPITLTTSCTAVIPLVLTTANGTTNLRADNVGNSIYSAQRFVDLSSVFLNVRFQSVKIEPTSPGLNAYMEWATVPTHIPYVPTSQDASYGVGTIAGLRTMPGSCRYLAGAGPIPMSFMRFNHVANARCERVITDIPTLFVFYTYSTVNVTWNIYVLATFDNIQPDL